MIIEFGLHLILITITLVQCYMFVKWYISYDLDKLDELIKERETYNIQRN